MCVVSIFDPTEKHVGRPPRVLKLAWVDETGKLDSSTFRGGRFVGVEFFYPNKDTTYCLDSSTLYDEFDPYTFYLIKSKRIKDNPYRWSLMVVDYCVLYTTPYHIIGTDELKILYDQTLTKELTAFEVLTYFGL